MSTITNWRHYAACAEKDLELFFPIGNGNATQRKIAAAQAICAECPVRTACLADAVEAGHTIGIFGGEDFDAERVATARRQAQREEVPA